MTTTTSRPSAISSTSRIRYSSQAGGVLLLAFAGSAAYTLYTTLAGLPADGFSATDPAAWAYYLVGFAAALFARTDRRAAWWVLAVLLPVLLAVSVLVYPASFVPALQTPLGWLENDGYVALLAIALYLTVQRLRRVRLDG
jgi:FtsH-binding integral membrane protein